MKKILLVLLMFVLVFSLFAEEAKVLPKGVLRVYVIPSYIFGNEAFDGNGDKQDAGDYTFFNLGGAVEYGLNDWVTAGFKWAPGINLSSDVDALPAKASMTGPFGLFVGAKLQLVGEKGLSQSDTIRFAVAPGIMIPMAFSYDPEEELTKAGAGDDYVIAPANNAFGLGARVYADYIVNKMFFINVYAEFIKFLAKDADKDFDAYFANLTGAGIKEVNYGYQLTTELEFYFSKPISEGLIFSAGFPVGYEYQPETTFDDVSPDSAEASYVLSINPNVSLFVTSLPLPLEFEASYKYPLMGQNALAKNVLTFQIKAYMKF